MTTPMTNKPDLDETAARVQDMVEFLRSGDGLGPAYLSKSVAAEHAADLRALLEERERMREAWDWLSEQTALELSFAHDWPDEGDVGAWQVHRVSGGRSDREWDLVASGPTALKAVTAARQALQGSKTHDR